MRRGFLTLFGSMLRKQWLLSNDNLRGEHMVFAPATFL